MANYSWLETLSDLTMALSYFSIPVSLASLASAQDLRISYFTSEPRLASSIKTLIVLIIAFIGLCGVTHLVAGVRGWIEDRMVTEVFKVLTAVVSFVTAAFLHRVLPILLSSLREIELTKRGLPAHLQRLNHMVFESSGHIMSIHKSEDLAFESVNDAIASLGMRKEDVLSSTLYELVEKEDVDTIHQSVEELKKIPDSTQEVKYHVWDSSAQRRRTMEASMFFSQDQRDDTNYQSHVLIISKDVTDRDEREAVQLERLKLVEANKTRMRYISSIAHDLKTPLTTFQLSLGLLEAGHTSADQVAIVHEAKVSVEMMSVVIGQALDSGRTEDGNQLQPKRGRVNINEMIAKCEQIMTNYAKCVPLSCHIDPEVSPFIITDGEWVWQMCINLMTNACKYTVDGYIRLDVSIVLGKDLPRLDGAPGGVLDSRDTTGDNNTDGGIGTNKRPPRGDAAPQQQQQQQQQEGEEGKQWTDNIPINSPPGGGLRGVSSRGSSSRTMGWDGTEFLCVSVSDTGIGVTNDKKNLLFKAFTQVQAMQSNGGTGLGLYSVKQKAVRLRGTCGMRDNVHCLDGRGSVFFFAVPYLPDNLDEAPFETDSEEVEATPPPVQRRGSRGESWPTPAWVEKVAAGYSYDVEAPTGKLGVATSSGATLDNTNLLNISSSRGSGGGGGGGGVEPASAERGGATLNVGKNGGEGEPKGRSPEMRVRVERDGQAGGGGGAQAVHADRGELERLPKSRVLEKGESFRQGDVLVVDDTSTVRSLLKRAVTRMGQGVDTACTGEEALHMLAKRPYQLVLCDLQMPVMDGPEFTQRWRVREENGQVSPSRRGTRQKIIGMSANGEAAEIQECKNCGMDGFCPKPINLAVLRALVDDHCRTAVPTAESRHGAASGGGGGGGGSGGGHLRSERKSSGGHTKSPSTTKGASASPRKEKSSEEASLLGDSWMGADEGDESWAHQKGSTREPAFTLY